MFLCYRGACAIKYTTERLQEEPILSTIESTTALPVGTWNVDPVHSQVGFAVEYVVGTFRGSFSPVDAKLAVAEDGSATLSGKAPVSGIKVQDENLEAHLQSPDFFDAENAPELTFASTAVRRTGDSLEIDGDLQIRGATQPVTLAGTVGKQGTDAYGQERFNLSLATTIDRTQFGIDWNNPLPNGEPSLANDVQLTAELYLVKA
jgi:polyisoprenoid-binding protein YceI